MAMPCHPLVRGFLFKLFLLFLEEFLLFFQGIFTLVGHLTPAFRILTPVAFGTLFPCTLRGRPSGLSPPLNNAVDGFILGNLLVYRDISPREHPVV
jgi:hypothetical protein